jgi:outer membrane protein assembly factor BamB
MSMTQKFNPDVQKFWAPASGRWWIRALIITICLLGLTSSKLSAQAILAQEGITSASLESNRPIYLPMVQTRTYSFSGSDWTMAAANPQRTSWVSEEVSGNLRVEWYRPIEAYIPQNSQIIASGGLLFISTARGLYTLDAADGHEVWRFDTELPLGNSPTVSDGVVYVAGYDRKLHALNAVNGLPLWSFDGAKAGYNTNPLVVDGKVFLGNRDGNMYAVGAHGTNRQGQLLWSYQTGGPINLSAAYRDGIVYFAANDNIAYALRAESGGLVWKSDKLPGDGFHSYWPIIVEDKIVFSAASGYRVGNPGTGSILDLEGVEYGKYIDIERDDIFRNEEYGTLVGPEVPSQAWAQGYPMIDPSRISEYYETKPWRRTIIVLNIRDGSEYTTDFDNDGRRNYVPFAFWGTQSGNRFPPIASPDEVLYQGNIYQMLGIPQGRVMGWKVGSPYLSVTGGGGAIDEPQSLSGGGNLIYRSICCDRVGDYFDTRRGVTRPQWLFTYEPNNLEVLAPGYDSMWTILPGWPRLSGWYKGNTDSINGIYHNHGDQNPIIPYDGRLYVHRSNAIIAFGPGISRGILPLLEIQDGPVRTGPVNQSDLRNNLEREIQKIVDAGPLRPGYYNHGTFIYRELANYFENPGDTLYTLSLAYPHLSGSIKDQTRVYLESHFQKYFRDGMYSTIGWAEGSPREAVPLPPEVEASLSAFPKQLVVRGWSWNYPQHNIYAMWKYATNFPTSAGQVYDLAKGKIESVPSTATREYFLQYPYELNGWIAGYIGFLELQQLANRTTGEDALLRATITTEKDRLLRLRAEIFTQDTPWVEERYHRRSLNVARNFMMLVPELGEYLHDNALNKVTQAVEEYDYIAPYWFVSRYESMINEGVMSPLYNYPAMFQAKAYILQDDQQELYKYLDVPAFERGDLFYIQNLIALIEAATSQGLVSSSQLCK